MDINKILKGGKCEACGRIHTCEIESVYIERGAIGHLQALCETYKSILLVADSNTYSAAGEKTERALAKKTLKRVIFEATEGFLIPDERAIETITKEISGVELIVGIGSGVIQDLCKYVSFFEKIPYMIVATAPSMDGYASNGAAMILKGMKHTASAGLPKAIIADVDVLKSAPMEMIKAGYGDIIGKFSALNDWKLSHAVNGEYLCEYIYDTTYDMITKTLESAEGLLRRDEESIRTLTEALIVVGIMMSFATTSRPASGSEHHLSHFFEITGIERGEAYLAHGIDVAYSTVKTAELREKLLSRPFPNAQYSMPRAEYEEKMSQIYGSVAQGCIELQDRIGSYNCDRVSIYKSREDEIRAILSEMPSAREITRMLEAVELDIAELYETYGEKKLEEAILYAKDLKDRYTVLWMNYDFFGGEEQ